MDEDVSTSNAEDNLEREVNEIINNMFGEQQSPTEAESDCESTLSRYGLGYLMYTLFLCTHICPNLFYRYSYALLWNNSHFHIQQYLSLIHCSLAPQNKICLRAAIRTSFVHDLPFEYNDFLAQSSVLIRSGNV